MNSDAKNLFKETGLITQISLSSSPVRSFIALSIVGVALFVAATLLFVGSVSGLMLGGIVYIFASVLTLAALANGFPHPTLGLCNVVTFIRLIIVCILVSVLAAGLPPSWGTFGIAFGALCLDGVDGWLARRQGRASDFGARFDVEVDAAFALVLAMFAAVNGAASGYVVLLGLPYYLFCAARLFMPWLGQPLPEKLSRKTVCVFQIGVLIAVQVPVLADGRLDFAVIAIVLALIWSFGRDILWLHRTAT